ncbi:MAG: SDR family oxidoreductase, partial [Desulfosalsimonas sp.]
MAEDIFPFQKSYDGRVSRRQIADKRRAGRSRILLTGATGFLGLHLAEMLVKKGYAVFLLVRPQNG